MKRPGITPAFFYLVLLKKKLAFLFSKDIFLSFMLA